MPGVPQIIRLFKDSDSEIHHSAIITFQELANCFLRELMKPGITQIIRLVNNTDWEVRHSAVNAFGILADHRKWTLLFDDGDANVCFSATETFGKLASNSLFHQAMKPGVPQLIAMFKDEDVGVRSFAIEAFGKLANHNGLHEAWRSEDHWAA
ncbi:armadillo-type protein [Mycena olivaceomarginata]|nr:armadillo-type protein [Mycena olivaceomarginata]